MAARLQADLCGVYIEDSTLLAAASLPFTQQLNAISARLQPLEPDAVARQMTMLAARARTQLSALAEERRVRWTFETIRGHAHAALQAHACRSDLVIATATAWTRVAGDSHSIAKTNAPVAALLPPGSSAANGPVVVLCTPTTQGQRTLAFAGLLAQESELFALLPDNTTDGQVRQTERRLGGMRDAGTKTHAVRLDTHNNIPTLLRRSPPGLLILPHDSGPVTESGLLRAASKHGWITIMVR